MVHTLHLTFLIQNLVIYTKQQYAIGFFTILSTNNFIGILTDVLYSTLIPVARIRVHIERLTASEILPVRYQRIIPAPATYSNVILENSSQVWTMPY